MNATQSVQPIARRTTMFVLIIALLAMSVRASVAADISPNPDPATHEQALKLVEVMGDREAVNTALAQMRERLEEAVEQQFRDVASPNVIEELKMVSDSTANEVYGPMLDQVLQDAVIVYETHVTRLEADAAIALFSSEAGRAYIAKLNNMGIDLARLTVPRFEEKGRELQDTWRQRLAEVLARHQITQVEAPADRAF